MKVSTNTVGDDIQMTGMLVDHNASGHSGHGWRADICGGFPW